MILRYLRNPEDPTHRAGHLYTDPAILRRAAVSLALLAIDEDRGRDVGDPIFEEITEGRRMANEKRRSKGSIEVPYSSCGDLAHWMLRRLGCRDERFVNRSDDGGDHPWSYLGTRNNVTMLDQSNLVVRHQQAPELIPGPGDIIFMRNAHGGHIAVVLSWDERDGAGAITSADYGQPYGRYRERVLSRRAGLVSMANCPLVWTLPIHIVPLDMPAEVPEDFELGVPALRDHREAHLVPLTIREHDLGSGFPLAALARERPGRFLHIQSGLALEASRAPALARPVTTPTARRVRSTPVDVAIVSAATGVAEPRFFRIESLEVGRVHTDHALHGREDITRA